MLSTFILILLITVQSAPVDVMPECAACQLFSITLANNHIKGNRPINVPTNFCSQMPQCAETLTHCEIVGALTASHPFNYSSEMTQRFQKVHSHLLSAVKKCEREPHAEVLTGPLGPALCAMCFLVYYFLQFLNNGILQMPLLNLIPEAIQLTCFIIANINHDITPPVCEALLADGALPALLKAIADSMGSFYDLIAVQAMGCPSYESLFGTC